MAAEAAGGEATSPGRQRKLAFLDLPLETQREIVSHTDLICVALVSKHFHELASAKLYRDFHIIFPDDDDMAYDSPIDGLAGGLDTFTTSEYNYAKHLRDLSMDTLSAGMKGEISYQSYLYSASCGKFLNTLLYLTLKKAKALEVFRWNIRVELSRQVYRELHRIPSLKKVHLRMQAGESYYLPPPPLPTSSEYHGPEPGYHWMDVPPPMTSTLSLPLHPYSTIATDVHSTLVPPSKQLPKSKSAKRGSSFQEPSTLSGFKKLKSLLVLDIDDLDITTELKACIQNSSTTLKELQLSLSEPLALQARKPPIDSDPDDSDVEDEFTMAPHAGNHNDGSGPAKAFRAQEERKVQEAFLGRVFDVVELPSNPGKALDKKTNGQKLLDAVKMESAVDDATEKDPHDKFIKSLRVVSDQLMKIVDGPAERTPAHEEVLEMIEKAARKYVESRQTTSEETGDKSEGNNAVVESSATAGALPNATDTDPSSSAPTDKQANGEDQALENIDMEHVDSINDAGQEFDDQKPDERTQQDSSALTSPKLSLFGGKDSRHMCPQAFRLVSQVAVYQTELERVKLQLSEISYERDTASGEEAPALSRKVEELEQCLNHISHKIEKTELELRETAAAGESPVPTVANALAAGQDIRNYLRETRGFCIESLSMYLVPVKASVLSRAIDLRSLRQLTLLNVGTQAPIWSLLAKENKVQPLPLRSVFTDNVSDAFLTCMSQLQELNELFMVERSAKTKPESFAPRTTNTMDQIRRVVLTKHMPTLKRLMIKDESSGSNWDASEKTMIYICTRGKQLEELGVSLNIQAVHAFMQYFAGLPQLRAFHILHFKNNDTCMWVMREILRFIVDNLSHHPSSKLEWIGMEDDRVERVVRTSAADERTKKEQRKKHRKKGKSPALPVPTLHDPYPVIPAIGLGDDSDSDSDYEMDGGSRLRFKVVGPMSFHDIWNVKIFEKEIRCGRL